MFQPLRRIHAALRRRHLDDELAEEIQHHLELRRQQLIDEGMDPERSRSEARRLFGNVTAIREQTHDLWSLPSLDTLVQDVRYGVRLLRRSPTFTTVAVMSLAVGIGSASVVFNVADAVLFRPLAVRAPDELRQFHATLYLGAGEKRMTMVSEPTLADMQRAADFADLIGFRVVDDVSFAPSVAETGRAVRVELVSANYFPVLGVPPLAGRTLGTLDDRGTPAIVLSERLWRSAFAGDQELIGRSVVLNRHPVIVAGVARDFRGLLADGPADVFLPVSAGHLVHPAASSASVWMVARLHAGVSPAVAEQKMAALFRNASPSMVSDGEQLRVDLREAARGVSDARASLEQPLVIALALAGVLLLVAATNTGGLLLARFAFRRGEFGVRLAIGASRGRLARQLLVEAVLLALIAAALGLVAAWAVAPMLLRTIPIAGVAPAFDVRVDWRLVGFTAGIAVASAIVAAAASLVRLRRVGPADMLSAESRALIPARRRLTHVLIAAQVACSLLLMTGAGSMFRSLINLRGIDPGFTTARTFAMSVDTTGLVDSAGLSIYFARLHERIAASPHVARSSLIQFTPMSRAATTGTVDVPGFSPARDGDRWIRMFFVGPGFFETMGIDMVAGRGVGPHDGARAERVAVVNEAFARFYFREPVQALGRVVNRDMRIVGVVANAHYDTLRDEPVRAMFVPYLQQARPRAAMTFVVRASGDLGLAIGAATAAVRTHDPQLRLKVVTLEDQLAATLSRERFVTTLASGLSVLALLLCCAGLYGTVSYAVSARRSELAVRLALGATRRDIVRLVVRDPLRTTAIGIAAGVPAVYVALRGLSALLFGVSPLDVGTVALCGSGLLVVAAAAAFWPARRAAGIDPLECLKCG